MGADAFRLTGRALGEEQQRRAGSSPTPSPSLDRLARKDSMILQGVSGTLWVSGAFENRSFPVQIQAVLVQNIKRFGHFSLSESEPWVVGSG
jgi:hypothetical protein